MCAHNIYLQISQVHLNPTPNVIGLKYLTMNKITARMGILENEPINKCPVQRVLIARPIFTGVDLN
jgi:uncharacterized linocin/CFP29 family protein